MCGIAGKLWYDAARPADKAVVAAMTAALAHRGPDGDGLEVDGPVALGHRRLAIVDLSERGRQPMRSTAGRCTAVVNGELYNHRELRVELAAAGHRFRSDCDSEVVLPLYRQYWDSEGPRFVDRLDGMFAFALWDADARRLVLARDRTGQKPLVYAATPQGISFASELGALGRDPDVDRRPDDQALADYLAFRCIGHPRTAWRGAAKLPPAHVLVVEDGALESTRYWRLVPGLDRAGPPGAPSFEEAAEQTRAHLLEATRRRLMSDVPVGAFLSGGLDSAAVVAAMRAAGAPSITTFSIGFEERDYDETPGARKLARFLGTDHHELIVRPDAVSLVDTVLAHHGEPFADGSSLPTLLVSQLAARHVKVVLTGDGADESYAGYERYRALGLAARLRSPLAAPVRAALAGAAALLSATGLVGGQRSPGARLVRFADAVAASPRWANHLLRLATPPALMASLLSADGRQRLGHPAPYGPQRTGELSLNEALALDVERYLPDDLLVKLDIASMAHSLEARSPFLDRRLLEHAASLPATYKLGTPSQAGGRGARTGQVSASGDAVRPPARGLSKRVLRRAVEPWLPADLRPGPKKGFGAPRDAWFRGPLLDHAREVLLSPDAARRGLFDTRRIGALLEAHAGGRVAAHETLYTLLVLERWFLSEENGP